MSQGNRPIAYPNRRITAVVVLALTDFLVNPTARAAAECSLVPLVAVAAVQPRMRRDYRRDHASVSTARRICSISSKCSCVQVSGGESWITGSPRSSVRQTSPASNSACDRKPRSSRSDSSSLNVSLVVLSLTSSMP
jgi:hypothetical protein